MIKLEFTGDTPEQIKLEMLRMCGVKIPPQATTAAPAPAVVDHQAERVTDPVPVAEPVAEPAPAPRRGRPPTKKAAKAEAAAERRLTNGSDAVTPEIEALDEADEVAEVTGPFPEDKALTHDNVRTALGKYLNTYGTPAAQEDGAKVLSLCFGEGMTKVSDIPNTQAALAKAIAGVKEMIEKNPYNRKPKASQNG